MELLDASDYSDSITIKVRSVASASPSLLCVGRCTSICTIRGTFILRILGMNRRVIFRPRRGWVVGDTKNI